MSPIKSRVNIHLSDKNTLIIIQLAVPITNYVVLNNMLTFHFLHTVLYSTLLYERKFCNSSLTMLTGSVPRYADGRRMYTHLVQSGL